MSRLPVIAVALVLLGACRSDSPAPGAAETAAARPAAFDAAGWTPPDVAALPADSLGTSIRRGLALMMFTPDSLPGHAPGRISCTNCHLDGGRSVDAAPLTGSHARFPKYMDRTGAVIGLADRVNYCFTRSLAGTRLPHESREMQDILAYLAWLSQGIPIGARMPGADGLPPIPPLTGDTVRGAAVFVAKCQVCHGPDGQGNVGIPALWGPRSYSIGASMSRHSKAASFIWHNMPLGQGRSLTHQEAWDVASYVNGQPRPDSPGKENDWPMGGAPADVPYGTQGHTAFEAPPLLPRANPRESIVPRPSPAATFRRATGT